MVPLPPNAVRSAVPGSPIEPCATMATDPIFGICGISRVGDQLVLMLYFAAHRVVDAFRATRTSRGRFNVHAITLPFDALLSAAKAVSDVVDALNGAALGIRCPMQRRARASVPRLNASEIVTTYNNTDYLVPSACADGAPVTSRPIFFTSASLCLGHGCGPQQPQT